MDPAPPSRSRSPAPVATGLRLFARLVGRTVARHRVIALFNVASLALGIGVYLAIRTANTSAEQAFRATIDVVAGRSHLEVRTPSGDLDESLLPVVAAHPAVAASTPVVEGFVTLAGRPGEFLHLVGVDLFTNGPFQTWRPAAPDGDAAGGGFDLEAWLGSGRTIAVTAALAGRIGLEAGDSLAIQVDGRTESLEIGSIVVVDPGQPEPPEHLAAMDIGWAQELLGRAGSISSIQVRLEDPARLGEVAAALDRELPPEVVVAAPDSRTRRVESMLEGFRLNLLALSMVSVLVGVFLIFNTVSASVVRRRREIGTLRSIGASRRQVASLFLGEALVFGVVGAGAGVPLGYLLASSLVDGVARTISVHYVLVRIDHPVVVASDVALAVGYGLVASLAGAWIPAREASRVDPVDALHPGRLGERSALRVAPLAVAGLAALGAAAGAAFLALATGPAWLSFGACLALVAAFSLVAPGASHLLAAAAAAAARRTSGFAARGSALVRLAASNFGRSLHRSAVTVAAVMASLAMVVGVSVMITSFRTTVERWIDATLVADVFVGPAANETLGLVAYLPDEVVAFARGLEGVDSVDTYLERAIRLVEMDEEVAMAVIDAPDRGNLTFVGGDADTKAAAFRRADHLIASESLAQRLGLADGQPLVVETPAGPKTLRIAGIFKDFTSDRGRFYITRGNFDRHWDDPRVHSMALHLEADTPTGGVVDAIRAEFGASGELLFFSNREIRERVFEIFDQTFAVTAVLRVIAVIVAVIGIILSLTTLVAERAREIAILRSIGAGRGQVATAYLAEAGLVGLAAGVLGVVCGLLLAVILTWVVNRAFFGWTIDFRIPWIEVALAPLWVTLVAVAAGLVPALRAGALEPAAALRND